MRDLSILPLWGDEVGIEAFEDAFAQASDAERRAAGWGACSRWNDYAGEMVDIWFIIGQTPGPEVVIWRDGTAGFFEIGDCQIPHDA